MPDNQPLEDERLAEDRLLRLTPHEVSQLESALEAHPEVVPQLAALLRKTRTVEKVAT